MKIHIFKRHGADGSTRYEIVGVGHYDNGNDALYGIASSSVDAVTEATARFGPMRVESSSDDEVVLVSE